MKNTSIRARDKLIAQLYQHLRIGQKDNPLENHSRLLFEEIERALIEATKGIYAKDQQSKSDAEASRTKDKKDE